MHFSFVAVGALAISLTLVGVPQVQGGKYNPVLKIGDPAPDWQDLPGVDDNTYSLTDFKDYDVLVMVFTCNSCPYAVAYEDRLVALAKARCAGKDARVALVAINVNKQKEDQLPAMRARAKSKKFSFPYLYDESQKSAKEYGATYTPEFFVLNKDRRIIYMGAMDDSDRPKQVKRRFVDSAIAAALQGKSPEVAETVAIGCTIRFERSRRRKRK